jgi:hypothetical protein
LIIPCARSARAEQTGGKIICFFNILERFSDDADGAAKIFFNDEAAPRKIRKRRNSLTMY